MFSLASLSAFNLVVLLVRPRLLASLLELVPLPFSARTTLLIAVVVNIVLSLAYEQWGTQLLARMIGFVMQLRQRRRISDGKMYKAVEGGMR